MKILLTGSNGQLGHDFKKIFDRKNIEYIATDHKELDITNDEDLNRFFQENEEITHVINCAAYNDVDKAETDKKVWLLNAEAPKKLAEFSKKIGAIFVTYTTDFVFDGRRILLIWKMIKRMVFQSMENRRPKEKKTFWRRMIDHL